MTLLTIDDLFTPATADQWKAQIYANAATTGLSTDAWEPGSPTRTILAIVAAMLSQGDGLVSQIAQGGFLDFAATGTVTYTASNGQTVTVPVTPDPSDPTANPTGALGWLDLLASSVYDVSRNIATYATGPLAVGNTAPAALVYAAGTYHVENPTTGATYTNAADINVPQGSVVGVSVTNVTAAAPIVVTTSGAHGLADGAAIVLSGVVGPNVAGVFVVTVASATSFKLNGTDGTTNPAYVSGGTVRTTSPITVVADLAGTGGTSVAGAITLAVTSNPGVYVANPSNIIGSGFETNTALAARCRARLASLSPNGPKGAYAYFALSASDILGNSSNPLFVAPAVTIPAITRADVVRSSSTGIVTTVIASAAGAVSGIAGLAISGVSAGTPIQITAVAPHGLSTGDPATISGVIGAVAANGTWTVTVVDATHFTLNGSAGGAVYAGGGIIQGGVLGQVDRVIQANAVPDTVTATTLSAVAFNVAVVATVVVPTAYMATYAVAVQTALALYAAALPIGGIDGKLPINDVIGVLYAAGIVGGSPSYVRAIPSVTLNGTAADAVYPDTFYVAQLSPSPVINVVGA